MPKKVSKKKKQSVDHPQIIYILYPVTSSINVKPKQTKGNLSIKKSHTTSTKLTKQNLTSDTHNSKLKISTLKHSQSSASLPSKITNELYIKVSSTPASLASSLDNLNSYNNNKNHNHFDDFVILWLDHNQIDIDMKLKLEKKTTHTVQIYSNVEKWQEIIPLIHDYNHIHSIYIYCMNIERYHEWSLQYSKIQNIFADQSNLIKHITNDLEYATEQLFTFNISTLNQKAFQDLTKNAAKFMWNQLLIEVLFRTSTDNNNYDIKAKKQMLDACRAYYIDNPKQIQYINKFEREYQQHNAIEWYTKETFLYKIINKALRTENIDALLQYQFYIKDLSKQLEQLHDKQYLK
ncbi:unnamed protein product, partial [Didymodactylos carnosus]